MTEIHSARKKYSPSIKKGRNLIKLFIWAIIFLIFLAAIFYLIFFSKIFEIKNIVVVGAQQVKKEDIEKIVAQTIQKKVYGQIGLNNFILLPENKIKDAILGRFAEIKSAAFQKNLKNHTLTLEISERNPAVVWCKVLPLVLENSSSSPSQNATSSDAEISGEFSPEIDKCFFTDEQGFIFKPSPAITAGFLTTVYSQDERPLNIRDTVTDEKTLSFILALKKEFSVSNLGIDEFFIKSQSPADLEILSSEGWQIYFDLTRSPDEQVNALKRVLQQEIKEKRTSLEYVDLRVSGRVYYKLRN